MNNNSSIISLFTTPFFTKSDLKSKKYASKPLGKCLTEKTVCGGTIESADDCIEKS
ncbi:hypothetical protein GCM10009118_16660 [Wandonia haliotis]|uniref:ShKT domain-containing protein n=1 Tax=Wandonia haliotis TaxID=574963 RepID=A0ABN1MPR3_9FLAO